MTEGLGYKGESCPVVNCYMRDEKSGACLDGKTVELKASHKIMRDTMAIVEIIEAARNAPSWVTPKTYPITSVGPRYAEFIEESRIQACQLQYVLDQVPSYNVVMQAVFKQQE